MHLAAPGSLGASRRPRWLAGLVAVGVLLMCALMAAAVSDASTSSTPMAGMSMSSSEPGAGDGSTATDDCGTLCPTGVGATCLLLVALGTVAGLWSLMVRPRAAGRLRRRRPACLPPRVARAAFRAPPDPWALCVMRC